MHTTRYWNNLHYAHSIKRLEAQVFHRSLWASRPKVLNRISTYDRGGITCMLINYLRYELYIQTIIVHLTIHYDTSIIIIWEDKRLFVFSWLYMQLYLCICVIGYIINTLNQISELFLLRLRKAVSIQTTCLVFRECVLLRFFFAPFLICHWSPYISVYSIVK